MKTKVEILTEQKIAEDARKIEEQIHAIIRKNGVCKFTKINYMEELESLTTFPEASFNLAIKKIKYTYDVKEEPTKTCGLSDISFTIKLL